MPGHDPNPEAEAIFDDANGDLALGDLAAAAEKYRRCTEIDPAYFDAWHALGMALLKSGDLKGATGAALMATDLQPNDLLAWTSLSQIYVRAGKIAEAEDAKGKARILSLGGKVVRDA
ncbi:MAG: tetratricopeptide repeat protein [Verrucomicrobiales bacterium]